MKKPTTTKDKAKPTKAVKPTTPKPEAKPRTLAPPKEQTTKPRKRPGKPFNLKVLYPKQPDLRKAIFSETGVKEAFREHLFKAGLFSMQGDQVSLILPEPRQRHRRGGYCDHPEDLLNELGYVLSMFFSHQHKTNGSSAWSLEFEISKAAGTIAGSRQLFLDARVPEKSFDAMVKRLERWMKMVGTSRVDQTEETPLGDLKVMLFHSYKRNSKLPNNQIFTSIGRLMKYLGYKSGTEEKIRKRLHSEYYERRKKAPPGILPEDAYLWHYYSITD